MRDQRLRRRCPLEARRKNKQLDVFLLAVGLELGLELTAAMDLDGVDLEVEACSHPFQAFPHGDRCPAARVGAAIQRETTSTSESCMKR